MINAILFDLFETLVTESHSTPTRAGSLGTSLGLDRAAFKTEWKARRPLVTLGRLSFADALTEISTVLSGRVNEEAVQHACEQRRQEKVIAFAQRDPDVEHMIHELHARRIRLGVISNGFAEDVSPWSTWPLAREFECRIFSCEAGLAKPDPEIYRTAMRELGVEAATTVYIGDGGDDELAGAERAGLRAFRATWFSGRQGGPMKQGGPEGPPLRADLTRCDEVSSIIT
jgi:HAD superfamily hydrolase (TIGR01509 family)